MQPKTNRIVITEFDRQRLQGLLGLLRARSPQDSAYLTELEEELERAEVVVPTAVPADVVTMNSEVWLSDLDTGEQHAVTLVFPGAAETRASRISVLAPVGLALLGCREKEELSWQTPRRVRRLRIERVLFQPEASGNFVL